MLWKSTLLALVAVWWINPSLDAQEHWFVYSDADRIRICPNCNHNLPHKDAYGWRGNPWRDRDLGGCRCGKHTGKTYYNASHHWPSPWSVLIDHGRNGRRWGPCTDTTKPRLRDHLDVLANIRLLPNPRCDNGYEGPHCDPWGFVGASRRGVPLATPESLAEPPLEMAPEMPPQRLPGSTEPPQPLAADQSVLPAHTASRTHAEMLWKSETIR